MLLVAIVQDPKDAVAINVAVLKAQKRPPQERDELSGKDLARWKHEYEVQMACFESVLKTAKSPDLKTADSSLFGDDRVNLLPGQSAAGVPFRYRSVGGHERRRWPQHLPRQAPNPLHPADSACLCQ